MENVTFEAVKTIIESHIGDCNCDSEKICRYCQIINEIKEIK